MSVWYLRRSGRRRSTSFNTHDDGRKGIYVGPSIGLAVDLWTEIDWLRTTWTAPFGHKKIVKAYRVWHAGIPAGHKAASGILFRPRYRWISQGILLTFDVIKEWVVRILLYAHGQE